MAKVERQAQARDERPTEPQQQAAAPPQERKRQPTDDEVETAFRSFLTQRSDTIAKFIRDKSSMTPLALVQAAGMAFRRDPDKLRDERSWRTVVTALVVAAQFDLEPIGREGWLVPREAKRYDSQTRRKVSLGFFEWSFMPSYQGLVKQALLSGQVRAIRSHVVYKNEHCLIQLGDTPGVDHRPTWTDRGEPVGVYAIARMTDGGIEIEPMPWSDVEKIRKAASDYSQAWETWPEEMARKCPLKRLTKQLPAGQAFAALVKLDNALESGHDDDRQSAIETALREKIALLPEAQRSPVEAALDGVVAGQRTRAASTFAVGVKRATEAQFAAAAVQNHEGAAVTRMTDVEAKSPPPNVACAACGETVRAGGLDVDDRWDVFDGRVLCSKDQADGERGIAGDDVQPDATKEG